MNKTVIRKWIKALRSGKYKQGQGRLKDFETGRYCCLGVLCEEYRKSDVGKKKGAHWDEPFAHKVPFSSSAASSFAMLEPPQTVRRWAGLTVKMQDVLINCNDMKNHSFRKIAARLEKWLTKGFDIKKERQEGTAP